MLDDFTGRASCSGLNTAYIVAYNVLHCNTYCNTYMHLHMHTFTRMDTV